MGVHEDEGCARKRKRRRSSRAEWREGDSREVEGSGACAFWKEDRAEGEAAEKRACARGGRAGTKPAEVGAGGETAERRPVCGYAGDAGHLESDCGELPVELAGISDCRVATAQGR